MGEAVRAGTAHLAEVGLVRFSSRAVAREIGYSTSGMLVWFGSTDLMLFRIGEGALARLRERMRIEADRCDDPVLSLVSAYFGFARDEPEVWKALYVHRMADGSPAPDFYADALGDLFGDVVDRLADVMENRSRPAIARIANSLMWMLRGHCEAEIAGIYDLVRGGGEAERDAVNLARRMVEGG